MSTPTYTNFAWVPKVDYTNCGSPVSYTFPLPQGHWDIWTEDIGGQDESDSGVMEAFQIRTDNGRVVRLRFFEDDWPDVQTFLEVVKREAIPFDLTFDQSDATTLRTVQLISPQVGERVTPRRDTEFSEAFMLEITVRESSGTLIDLPYDPRP